MKLDPKRFNRFLGQIGQHITWRKADTCPCRDPNSGAPNPDCTVCANGVIWADEKKTYLALSGQKLQQQWAVFGSWQKGDVVCTLPSDSKAYGMGERDRVRFDDSTQPFSLNYVNSGTIKLDYIVTCFERLFWLDDNLTTAIDGSLPTVKNDGTLVFGAKAPPSGKQFTVTGRRNPEYYAFMEFPQDRAHFGGEDLPRRIVLRNFDLFKRNI